jgi:hypothetical protein
MAASASPSQRDGVKGPQRLEECTFPSRMAVTESQIADRKIPTEDKSAEIRNRPPREPA